MKDHEVEGYKARIDALEQELVLVRNSLDSLARINSALETMFDDVDKLLSTIEEGRGDSGASPWTVQDVIAAIDEITNARKTWMGRIILDHE